MSSGSGSSPTKHRDLTWSGAVRFCHNASAMLIMGWEKSLECIVDIARATQVPELEKSGNFVGSASFCPVPLAAKKRLVLVTVPIRKALRADHDP